jgi:hypothetical protein
MQDSAPTEDQVDKRLCWYPSQYGASLDESVMIEFLKFSESQSSILLVAGIARESWRRLASGQLRTGRDTRTISKSNRGAIEEIRIDLELGESFDLIRIYFSSRLSNFFVGLLVRVKRLDGDRESIRDSQNHDIEIADEIYAKAEAENFEKCWRLS